MTKRTAAQIPHSGIITNIGYINNQISMVTDFPHAITRTYVPHYHDNPIISLVLQGGNSERRGQQVYECLPGQLVFYNSGEVHQTICKVYPSRCINLEFDLQFLRQHQVSENVISRNIRCNLDAKFLMVSMCRELLVRNSYTTTSIQMLLLGLVAESARLNFPGKPAWVKTVIEILNDRWNDTVSLQELSLATGVHPVTISRYFPRYFSCTLGEYTRKLKIDRSIALLRHADLSLTDVALACGFADQSHFTRSFKAITGFLPKQLQSLTF